MEPINGENIVGYRTSSAGAGVFRALNPATNQALDGVFHDATLEDIDAAMLLAERAFDAFRCRAPDQIAGFLEAIAAEIEALGDALLTRAHQETALPLARLTSERQRTVSQTLLFARLAREQAWIDPWIDSPLPDRKPQPRPDLRRRNIPIGPVVVMGASNFPLAISVVSCDTLAALAVGCPVVVKAHPCHPGTSELMGRAVTRAAQKTDMPEGVFSLLQGAHPDVAMALVRHPLTQALAFTGSTRVGRILADAAARRKHPIPVYAEMGSANPVFMLPGAVASRRSELAAGFAQSMTLGVGQFCTKPGVLVSVNSPEFRALLDSIHDILAKQTPATMLSPGICSAFNDGVRRMLDVPGVSCSPAIPSAPTNAASGVLFTASCDTWNKHPELREENFGPAAIAVMCDSMQRLKDFAAGLDGQLTATVHATTDELREHRDLLRTLERKAGRIVINGFPTGVEVGHAMHHGGPAPATTHSYFNSIGASTLLKFVRPVCYQSCPDDLLPAGLDSENSQKLWRRVDGKLSQAHVS